MSNDGLHEYQIGKTLGQGSTATVKLVMHVLTNEKYAMKIFNSQKTNRSIRPEPNFSNNHDINVNKLDYYDTCRTPETTPLFKLEIQLLLRLHHPNIIKVYQIIKRRTDCIYIMDFACNGMLLNKLNTRAYIPEPEARKYFRQLVSAIDHCHLSTIVHRDIKLENLLLDANDNLLVSDFGLATIADKDSQEKVVVTFIDRIFVGRKLMRH